MVIEKILLDLIVAKGAEKGFRFVSDWYAEKQRKQNFAGMENISESFIIALNTNLKKYGELHDHLELQTIDVQLYTLEMQIGDQELLNHIDATNLIVNAICNEYNLDQQNILLVSDIKAGVTGAFGTIWKKYEEELEHQGFKEHFSTDSQQEVYEGINSILNELDIIRRNHEYNKYYHIFNTNKSSIAKALDLIVEETDIEQGITYIPRAEIDDQDLENILLVGRKGTGKTRALTKLVKEFGSRQDIHHILVIPRSFVQESNVRPLLKEQFDGNVLLVWDNIHAVDPPENRLFRQTIIQLNEVVNNKGHSLWCICTARSENLNQLPNYDDPEDQVWSRFSQVELADLNSNLVSELVREAIDYYGVMATDEMRRKFEEKVKERDPSPLYIISTLRLISKDNRFLSIEQIDRLPEELEKLWIAQYNRLAAQNKEGRLLLWSLKILHDLGLPYYRSLAMGIYYRVLGGERVEFTRASNDLEGIWFRTESPSWREESFHIHEVQLEVIDERTDDFFRDIKIFLDRHFVNYVQSDQPHLKIRAYMNLHSLHHSVTGIHEEETDWLPMCEEIVTSQNDHRPEQILMAYNYLIKSYNTPESKDYNPIIAKEWTKRGREFISNIDLKKEMENPEFDVQYLIFPGRDPQEATPERYNMAVDLSYLEYVRDSPDSTMNREGEMFFEVWERIDDLQPHSKAYYMGLKSSIAFATLVFLKENSSKYPTAIKALIDFKDRCRRLPEDQLEVVFPPRVFPTAATYLHDILSGEEEDTRTEQLLGLREGEDHIEIDLLRQHRELQRRSNPEKGREMDVFIELVRHAKDGDIYNKIISEELKNARVDVDQ